jgi:MFS family permease
MTGGFGAMQLGRFRVWLLGSFFAGTGEWAQRTAQDWLVLTGLTNHSGFATGATVSLQYLPVLLFAPYAGVLADRLPRRRLLMVSQTMIAINSLTMCTIVVTHTAALWMVMCSAFFLGCGSALDLPSRQAFVAELVPRGQVMSAIGLNGATTNIGRMTGPALAGLVIAGWGNGEAFAVTTFCAVSALTSLTVLRRTTTAQPLIRLEERVTVRAALRYVRGRPDLVVLLAGIGLVSMFASHSALTTALMATSVYHRGSNLYAVVSTALALGSVVGSILAAHRNRPRLSYIVVGAVGLSVVMVTSSLMPNFTLYAMVLFPLGTFMMTYFISTTSALQIATPPHLRGRILALFSAVQMGSMAVGSTLVGSIGQVFGAPWSVRSGACASLAAGAVIYLFAVRRPAVAATFSAAVEFHIAADELHQPAVPAHTGSEPGANVDEGLPTTIR